MIRRRRSNQENPAWPGLVDIFAFTLVVFVVAYIAETGNSKTIDIQALETEIIEQNLSAARDSLSILSKENSDIKGRNIVLEAKIELFQEGADEAKEQLTKQARIVTEKLRQSLEVALGEDWGQLQLLHPDLPEFQISKFRGKPVYFKTGKWGLSEQDRISIEELRESLILIFEVYPQAQIEVNGTADPQPFEGKWQIRDNVDLSAMRAATVAKLLALKNTSGEMGIQNKILVVGLGETGKILKDVTNPNDAYAKYRTVTLKIRIPIDQL